MEPMSRAGVSLASDSRSLKGGERATSTTEKPQAPMQATPQKEHRWLDKLVGEWTSEGEAWEVGKPAGQAKRDKFSGTERVRSIGGLWTVAEAEGEMPGAGHGISITTLG